MKSFNDWAISKKLVSGFLGVLIMMVIIGLFGYFGIKTTGEAQKMTYEKLMLPAIQLSASNAELLASRGDITAAMSAPTPELKKKYLSTISGYTERMDKIITTYENSELSEKAKNLASELRKNYDGMIRERDVVVGFLLKNEDQKARDYAYGPYRDYLLKTRTSFEEQIKLVTNEASDVHIRTEENIASTQLMFVLIIIVSTIVSLFFAFWLARKISRPIVSVSEIMKKLSLGDLPDEMKISSSDEVGEMVSSVNKFIDYLKNGLMPSLGKISTGDMGNISLVDLSRQDKITPKLRGTIVAVNTLVDEVRKLIEKAGNGELSYRADDKKVTGEYKQIITGINQMLDSLLEPVTESIEILAVAASGDFTTTITTEFKGDYGKLSKAINQLITSMNTTIGQVTDVLNAVASASAQISSSAEEMAAGSEEQSAQTSEVATAVEEMAKTATEGSIHAEEVHTSTEKVKTFLVEGGESMDKLINFLNEFFKLIQTSDGKVNELVVASNMISEIIVVIEEIADQTNLLALNAAIEAARAGEQGRGFAVVADEVRKLAERTAKSLTDAKGMVNKQKGLAGDTTNTMNSALEEIKNGIILVNKSAELIKNTISLSEQANIISSQQAAASSQQAATAEQIAKTIDGIRSVVNESADATQQVAQSVTDLDRLINNLQKIMSNFKIFKSQERGLIKY